MTIDMPKPSQIPALRRLWQQAFGDSDSFLDSFFSLAFAPERCRCLMAGDTLAAALYWFDCNWGDKKVAYIYAVATDEAYRGKGCCRILMADTHAHLQSLSYAGAALVPGNAELFRLYEKCGYQSFCPMTLQRFFANKDPLAFRQVSASAYCALQKQLSPDNSVFHRQKTLAFGSSFLKYYAADGFAFCVGMEDDQAEFQEFLGDEALLPGILAGLQVSQGLIRLPGGKDYAMYCPFDNTTQLPAYFGIPLN